MTKEMASGTAIVSPGLISPAASAIWLAAPLRDADARRFVAPEASLPSNPSIDTGLLEMFWMKATSSTIWRMWIEKSTPPPHSVASPVTKRKSPGSRRG